MKTFKTKIEGVTPLMQHRMPEETLFGLLGAKTKKKVDKETLTPREIAEKHSYMHDGHVYVPADYIVGALVHVSGDYKQRNSTRKSLRAIIGGVVRPTSHKIFLYTKDGSPVSTFEVDVRKATNHTKGAIAVCRPRIDDWTASFELEINDDLISPETCLEVLQDAGRRSGIGSYRVQKGGYFGQFQVSLWEALQA